MIRFDDGTLIPDEPVIAGIRGSKLGFNITRQRVVVAYAGRNAVPIRLRNFGTAPMYWPRVTAAETHGKEKRKFDVFIRWPERAAPVVEPGDKQSLRPPLGRGANKNPTRFDEEIKFTATGLNCEPVECRSRPSFDARIEVGPVVLETERLTGLGVDGAQPGTDCADFAGSNR